MPHLSGLWMNVYQAAEQMRLWAGIESPMTSCTSAVLNIFEEKVN